VPAIVSPRSAKLCLSVLSAVGSRWLHSQLSWRWDIFPRARAPPKTAILLRGPHLDGHQAGAQRENYPEWDLSVYHGELPLLSPQQARLAEQHSTQLVVEQMLREDPT